jgi:hypothetical protein
MGDVSANGRLSCVSKDLCTRHDAACELGLADICQSIDALCLDLIED